jgi:hypothetical protein
VVRGPPGPAARAGGQAWARVGQKGRTTHVWYQKGVRPRGVREQRFARVPKRPAAWGGASVHLFGAVCPERDAGVALVLPETSTLAMSLFLAEVAQAIPAGTHAVLILDRAGWHISAGLQVPWNLTLVHLPPHSPELNPVETVWLYLRERWLSHRVLAEGMRRSWTLPAPPGTPSSPSPAVSAPSPASRGCPHPCRLREVGISQ